MAEDKNKTPKESFFKGVISEMEKTSWPTGPELVKYTTIVIVFLIFFYALDLGIGRLIELIS